VVPHLAACRRLTNVQLTRIDFRAADLQAFAEALPQLQTLKFIACELASLFALCLLQQLLTLELLKCSSELPDLSVLTDMPSLRSFSIHMIAPDGRTPLAPAQTRQLVAHLAGCRRLTELGLAHVTFTDAGIKALVKAVPRLVKCAFEDCKLPPLSALRDMQQLRELRIANPSTLKLDWVSALAEVRHLRVLHVGPPRPAKATGWRAQLGAHLGPTLKAHQEINVVQQLLRSDLFAHIPDVHGPNTDSNDSQERW